VTPARVIVELARARKTVSFVAQGGSMWPAIRSGSVVEIAPCDPVSLEVGDLAAYERDGRVVVHRIIGRGERALRFRGDALPSADGEVALDRVLGRARVVRQRRLRLRWPTARHLARVLRAVLPARRRRLP